jgi:hypothetical protein
MMNVNRGSDSGNCVEDKKNHESGETKTGPLLDVDQGHHRAPYVRISPPRIQDLSRTNEELRLTAFTTVP